MRGLESKIWEQIGFHVEGDLGRAMPIAEKSDVWRAKGKGEKTGQKPQKARKWVREIGTTKF